MRGHQSEARAGLHGCLKAYAWRGMRTASIRIQHPYCQSAGVPIAARPVRRPALAAGHPAAARHHPPTWRAPPARPATATRIAAAREEVQPAASTPADSTDAASATPSSSAVNAPAAAAPPEPGSSPGSATAGAAPTTRPQAQRDQQLPKAVAVGMLAAVGVECYSLLSSMQLPPLEQVRRGSRVCAGESCQPTRLASYLGCQGQLRVCTGGSRQASWLPGWIASWVGGGRPTGEAQSGECSAPGDAFTTPASPCTRRWR